METEPAPRRKQNRLVGYDYSAPGAYFLTICTHEKRCFLSRINVGALHEAPAVSLSPEGEIVRQVIESLPERFPALRVEKYVIMPNHVHLLLVITSDRALREAPLRSDRGRSLLAKAVGYLKMNSSRQIRVWRPELVVWQRSFHDHIVRGEADYLEIWSYIDGNPTKWTEDRFYPSYSADMNPQPTSREADL